MVMHGLEMRQLKEKRMKSDTRKNFFTTMTVKPWDRWPRETVHSPPSEVFKARLDKTLRNLTGLQN